MLIVQYNAGRYIWIICKVWHILEDIGLKARFDSVEAIWVEEAFFESFIIVNVGDCNTDLGEK